MLQVETIRRHRQHGHIVVQLCPNAKEVPMSVCVPVRDMKDTAAFTTLVESERDVTVTKNGYEAMHCISSDQYRLMQEEIAKAKLLSRMMLAEDEISQGDYSDYESFAASIRDKYDL